MMKQSVAEVNITQYYARCSSSTQFMQSALLLNIQLLSYILIIQISIHCTFFSILGVIGALDYEALEIEIAEMFQNASSLLTARTSASSRERQPTSEKDIERVLSAQSGKQNVLMIAPYLMAFSRQLIALRGYTL